jgi:hypothetical protein
LSDYHRMSVAEKERHNRQHDTPARCPECYQAIMPTDEEAHVDRCQGRPAPGPRSRWLTHREVLALGVSKAVLARGVRAGKLRTKDHGGRNRYLMRDITRYKADRKRRGIRRERKGVARVLTKASAKDQKCPMPKTPKPLQQRLATFVDQAGSYTAASRKLDVPVQSLKKVAKGESVRNGTIALIENQLREAGE